LTDQNLDGGWGESCLSDESQQYIPLGFSTPSQTAWALDALIAAELQENPAVTRGVESLLKLVEKNGTETSYPTGAGLPGGFYINYHSYRCVWPLLALSHYLKR
jgi:sporulenol synthase